MKFDGLFLYKLKKLLRFGLFSLFVFFITIRIIIGNDFGEIQLFSSFVYGVIVGLIYEITNTPHFYRYSFVARNAIRASLLFLAIIILIFVIEWIETGSSSFSELILLIHFDRGFSMVILNIFIVTAVVVLTIQLEGLLGPSFLIDFVLSKYNKPIEQNRIVMFLDLKDSTTIAERIGSTNFVTFINFCYKIMSVSIIKNKAIILKYVGDEIILTWTPKKGLKNSNCINFYFDFIDELEKHKNTFIKEYGVFPVFKAGVHYGKVTASFIGEIKKQMDLSGDVMNTTARIESICNDYDANILISENLYNALPKNSHYKYTNLGAIELKGKQEKVGVYKVDR